MRPLLALLPLVLAACLARPLEGLTGPDARPTAPALAALADSLTPPTLARPGVRAAVLRRALVRGGLSPLGDVGRRSGPEARYQGAGGAAATGFVVGRDPIARGDLVVLAAPVDGLAAAEVALAALVLAERARWTAAPERTVQVVFWEGDASDPVARALGAALWPRERVRAVVRVGAPGRAAREGVEVIAVPPGAGGLALVDSVLAATLRAARPAAPPDTLSALE